ncbi:MAG: alpha/beta fold hydrolase [Bacteroidota bacterium]
MKAKYLCLVFAALFFSCKPKAPELVTYPCDFSEKIKLGANMECGYLEVPENHAQPDGRKIKIAYVVLKSKNETNAGYPMIYFSGGPGGASLSEQAITGWSQVPFLENRDIILFDQRGIQYSSALPDIGPTLFDAMAADATPEKERELFAAVLESYKQKALIQGIDLGSYNSFENARDVGLLMKHLGYEKYNLFGGSYGTRLARVVQDMFPEKINGVILDSPAPMQTDFLISRLESYSLALQRIFDFCETDPNCSENYPDLKNQYIEAINSLKEIPMEVPAGDDQTFYVNAQDALYFLRRHLYWNTSRESVPAFIKAIHERQPEPMIQAVDNEKNGMIAFLNTSMLLSVENHEQFNAKYTSEVIDSIYQTLPLFPDKLGFFTALYETGHIWHDNRLPHQERVFKPSAVPTLIFVNQYDPVTPPEYGPIFKKKLSNAQLFVLDQGGHGATNNSCAFQVMTTFMDNTDISALDTSCLNLYQGD